MHPQFFRSTTSKTMVILFKLLNSYTFSMQISRFGAARWGQKFFKLLLTGTKKITNLVDELHKIFQTDFRIEENVLKPK